MGRGRVIRLVVVSGLVVVAGVCGSAAGAVAGTSRGPGLAASGRAGSCLAAAGQSAPSAWVVGATGIGTLHLRPVMLAWNGTAWKRVSTPDGTVLGRLSGVAAVSATNVWAVGGTAAHGALILHWNGRTWRPVPLPALGPAAQLYGVAATSARNAWAVGSGPSDDSLILHWNGKTWRRLPGPIPAGSDSPAFSAVAVDSARNAWAVGTYADFGSFGTLTEHWNGTAWKLVPSPGQPAVHSPGGVLTGVAVTPRDTWAVGSGWFLRWNGTKWKQLPAPNGGPNGVVAVSATDAWAVGSVIEHWNGTTWRQVHAPAGTYSGVGAGSATDIWAAGTGVVHWNGTTWRQFPIPVTGRGDFLSGVAVAPAARC